MEAENNEEILLGELKDHNDPERVSDSVSYPISTTGNFRQGKTFCNRDRDVHLADAVNSAFAEYEKAMKPDIVQRLLKAQKEGAVKENHERSFPAAMELFDKAVEDFVDEPELVVYKRNLLCDMIKLRYDDLLHANVIHELHNKVELLFNGLLEEHWKILKQHVETTTSLGKIDESIENCQHLLNAKYGLKKREFVLEAEAVLPNVSLQTVEQMLDNCQVMQLMMKMMEAMNQNAEKQIERMHEKRLQQIQIENARREAEAQREMEMRKEMAKDRREFEERLHEQENQRRADELANREAMQRQIEQMQPQQRDFMSRPPPREKSCCSIM